MGHYLTKDRRRVSIFSPITRKELKRIPDARNWPGRTNIITDSSYRELQRSVVEAFATESEDYVLGYVSGLHAAMDCLNELMQGESSYEVVWNNLMLLISEAARWLPPNAADDETSYIQLPTPGSQDN